jgi:alpha-L-arabinofuranosidase
MREIAISTLTASYAKFPLKFTPKEDNNEGRLEIVGTGSGSFHFGVVSLMPADNVSGFKIATIRMLKELDG